MTWVSIQNVAHERLLYLTTIGRRTGLPRQSAWRQPSTDKLRHLPPLAQQLFGSQHGAKFVG
jgi:hypothetical protein